MITCPVDIPATRLNPVTGIVELNPLRDLVRSWTQGTARRSAQSIAASQAAEDTFQVEPEKGFTGDFLITHFTSDHLGPYRAQFYVGAGVNRNLSDQAIHVDCFAGTAEQPIYLPTPLYVQARGFVTVKFTNLCTGITNEIRLKAHGLRFLDYEGSAGIKTIIDRFLSRIDCPYYATLDDTSVTLTASQTQARYYITLPSDSDFEAEFLVGKTQGPGRIQIFEGANGRPIMQGGGAGANVEQGVEFSHVLGSARNPYRFSPGTAFFKRKSKISVVLDDTSAASNQVHITLVGRLLYTPEARRRSTSDDMVPEARVVNAAQLAGLMNFR